MSTDPIALIPLPRQFRWVESDPFALTSATSVVVGESSAEVALGSLAVERLAQVSGLSLPIRHQANPDDPAREVVLRTTGGAAGQVGPERMPLDEAYTLVADDHGVLIEAAGTDGLVRGLATLGQLVRTDATGAVTVPAVQIADEPVHGWRGLSVDICRHFFGPSELRRVIELLADYKFNVLHLHLTDDQGWRIELPSHPELTARSSQTAVDGDPGGFLTTEDYRALVEFAAVRGVRVIPEFDLPGHVNAALHAVPELNPGGVAPEPYTGIEVGFSKLSAELPATEPFIRDVFGDLADLTPGEYLHIGGDEVLTMEKEEYAQFVEMSARAVRDRGKKVVGWQEIANTSLEPGTVVQFWDTREDPAPFVAAAKAGARLLMSPAARIYLDMKYYEGYPIGLEWAGYVTLRDSYDWEPTTLVEGLPPQAVVGVEAGVWAERIRDIDELMTMLLPRLPAVAEVAWTEPGQRHWEDFAERVVQHAPEWTARGLRWHPAAPLIWPEDHTQG